MKGMIVFIYISILICSGCFSSQKTVIRKKCVPFSYKEITNLSRKLVDKLRKYLKEKNELKASIRFIKVFSDKYSKQEIAIITDSIKNQLKSLGLLILNPGKKHVGKNGIVMANYFLTIKLISDKHVSRTSKGNTCYNFIYFRLHEVSSRFRVWMDEESIIYPFQKK